MIIDERWRKMYHGGRFTHLRSLSSQESDEDQADRRGATDATPDASPLAMTVPDEGTRDAGSGAQAVADARQVAVEALARVEEGERNSLDRLRDAVCGYLTALRAEGFERDAALDLVRGLISTPASSDDNWLLPAAREALTDLATHWCTQQYTGEPGQSGPRTRKPGHESR